MKKYFLYICIFVFLCASINSLCAMQRRTPDETPLSPEHEMVYRNKKLISFVIALVAGTTGYRLAKSSVVKIIQLLRQKMKVGIGPIVLWRPGDRVARDLHGQFQNFHLYAALFAFIAGYFITNDMIVGTLPLSMQYVEED